MKNADTCKQIIYAIKDICRRYSWVHRMYSLYNMKYAAAMIDQHNTDYLLLHKSLPNVKYVFVYSEFIKHKHV